MRDDSRKRRLAPAGLVLDAEGIAAEEGGVLARARWDEVFGLALVPAAAPRRLYVLLPRPPPAPPWIEVRPEMVPPDLAGDGDLGALAARLRARIEGQGYRAAPRVGPRRTPSELLRGVLAREPIPGEVTVPLGRGPTGLAARAALLVGASGVGGVAGLALGALAVGSGPFVAGAAAVGAVAGTAVPLFSSPAFEALRRPRARVLVLCPDGCVVGLSDGVRAFAWEEVAGFREGAYLARGLFPTRRACLEIAGGPDGDAGAEGVPVLGRVDAAWFGRPLPLVVSVAEAYRRRWGAR